MDMSYEIYCKHELTVGDIHNCHDNCQAQRKTSSVVFLSKLIMYLGNYSVISLLLIASKTIEFN